MQNNKSGRAPIAFRLGRRVVTKKMLKDIEKIILKRTEPKDHWVGIGRPKGIWRSEYSKYDFAKDIPSKKLYLWASVNTKARNISVKFTPFTSSVTVQRVYAKGKELDALNTVADELSRYLHSNSKSYLKDNKWQKKFKTA